MTYDIEIKVSGLDEQTYNRLMDEFKNIKNSEVTGQPVLNKADCSTQLPPLSDYDIRMLFYNNSDCYADSPDVIPAVTIDKFTEILREISGRQLS